MRRIAAALLCGTLVFNSGCSAIRDELRYPGGAAARMLDRRMFDASRSKQLQLLRATLAIAIAARIGEGSISPEDGDAFARQLAEAALEVNYAASEAGFAVYDADARAMVVACAIGEGKLRANLPPAPAPAPAPSLSSSPYQQDDDSCVGYYSNFEAQLSKIESRVVRAMLTSLPTDKAREFLNKLTKGDLLSAVWSLAQSAGDVAGAFHRGAGAYRAGLETVAAATPTCQWDPTYDGDTSTRFDERYDTVLVASACLGLSHKDLFDSEDIAGGQLPNEVPARAFQALFRVARSACVGLPLLNVPSNPDKVQESMGVRRTSCALVRFEPRERPHSLPDPAAPAPAPGPTPAPNAGSDRVDPEDLQSVPTPI